MDILKKQVGAAWAWAQDRAAPQWVLDTILQARPPQQLVLAVDQIQNGDWVLLMASRGKSSWARVAPENWSDPHGTLTFYRGETAYYYNSNARLRVIPAGELPSSL